MKKIINFVVAILVVFALYGCASNNQTLSTPTNVRITEDGYITWNEVDNASSYVITINDETFVASTNSFQVKDISDNFTFTVRAEAVGYNPSRDTERVEYISKSAKEINQIYEYTLSVTIGNREDADNIETYDKNCQLIKKAAQIAYEYGLTAELISSIVETILDDSITNKDNISGFIISMLMYFVGLTNEQVTGLVYYVDYLAQISINSLIDSFEGTGKDVMLSGLIELLTRKDFAIVEAFSNILIQTLTTYRQIVIQILPKINDLIKNSNELDLARNIVQLKELIVTILLNNVVEEDDLEVVLDFTKNALLLVLPFTSNIKVDNPMLKVVIDQAVVLLQNFDSSEVAKSIIEAYEDALNSLDYITVDVIAKALTYEEEYQAIGYIILEGIKNNLPNVSITSNTLKQIIDLVWYEVGLIMPDLKDVAITDIINMSEESFAELIDAITHLFNDYYRTFRNFITSNDTIEALVEALKFNVDDRITADSQIIFVNSENVFDDALLSQVFNKYGISDIEEDLIFGNEYVLVDLAIVTNRYICLHITTITILRPLADQYNYYYEIDLLYINNIDSLLPIIDNVLKLVKNESVTIIEDLKAIVKVIINADLITDESLKTVLTLIGNLEKEDIESVVNDAVTLCESFIEYVKKVGANKFIEGIVNNGAQELLEFVNDENLALVKLLVSDFATMLDNAELFPINWVFGDAENTFTLKFDSKEEFIATVNEYIDAFITSYPIA